MKEVEYYSTSLKNYPYKIINYLKKLPLSKKLFYLLNYPKKILFKQGTSNRRFLGKR